MSEKLVGETIIELTDASGNTEVYKDKNLVTNGLQKWFSLQQEFSANLSRFSGALGSNSIYYDTSKFAGIPGVFGGMVAFEQAIAEEPDNFTPPYPSENALVACANQFVNTSPFTKRGSPNLTESGTIEGGYRFVWDFTTAQGNGQISCICLCHPCFGFNGMDMFPYNGPATKYYSAEPISADICIGQSIPSFSTSKVYKTAVDDSIATRPNTIVGNPSSSNLRPAKSEYCGCEGKAEEPPSCE